MKNSDFIRATGIVAAGMLVGNINAHAKDNSDALAKTAKKPNIIFILADDLGVGELSCYGADNYKIPNIDRLASKGIRFTHSYTPSLSGPSRATILTGRYLYHTGATNQNSTGQMKPSVETMMPGILKSAGYVTASIGKWGQLPLLPSDFGFDDYLKFTGSGIYWNTQVKGKTYLLNSVEMILLDREYMPDVMHNHLINFLTENRDKPFYIYYSLSHVHSEILPTPESTKDSQDIYADNIAYMDKLVGKLINELDRLKLSDNTILVFFGDNGTAVARADRAMIGGRRLSGAKGSMLEGGSLEPLIVYWPGVTPVGKVSDDLISSADFVPTFAEIAGAKLPENTIIDGQSFNAQIHGEKGHPRSNVFIQLGNRWYVRDTNWKLTESGNLFDMTKAPFEEIIVPADSKNPSAIEARKRLQKELDKLNPAGGIVDNGDGTGRAKVTGRVDKNNIKKPQNQQNNAIKVKGQKKSLMLK